jgi:hypothetical protein
MILLTILLSIYLEGHWMSHTLIQLLTEEAVLLYNFERAMCDVLYIAYYLFHSFIQL